MKRAALLRLLERQPRTKIHVLTEQFCLSGYASDPREGPAGLRVHIGASVRVVFVSRELLHEPKSSGTLLLTDDHKITRRLHTHRRHLRTHDVPEEYFEHAKAI